ESNFERVYAFVVHRVQDRHEAEDLTSEVFEHALANLSRFEWRGVPFAVWLYRIAANAIADRWRQASRQMPDPPTDDDLDQSNWQEIERRATLCFSSSTAFRKINAPLLFNVSSSKKAFATLRKNFECRR